MAKEIQIQNHILVPEFEKLSEEAVTQLLERLNISILQLPKIVIKDPMAKAVEAVADDVIKTKRVGPTGKVHYYYRRVVE